MIDDAQLVMTCDWPAKPGEDQYVENTLDVGRRQNTHKVCTEEMGNQSLAYLDVYLYVWDRVFQELLDDNTKLKLILEFLGPDSI